MAMPGHRIGPGFVRTRAGAKLARGADLRTGEYGKRACPVRCRSGLIPPRPGLVR